MEVRLQ